jgi:hypothetical protein
LTAISPWMWEKRLRLSSVKSCGTASFLAFVEVEFELNPSRTSTSSSRRRPPLPRHRRRRLQRSWLRDGWSLHGRNFLGKVRVPAPSSASLAAALPPPSPGPRTSTPSRTSASSSRRRPRRPPPTAPSMSMSTTTAAPGMVGACTASTSSAWCGSAPHPGRLLWRWRSLYRHLPGGFGPCPGGSRPEQFDAPPAVCVVAVLPPPALNQPEWMLPPAGVRPAGMDAPRADIDACTRAASARTGDLESNQDSC